MTSPLACARGFDLVCWEGGGLKRTDFSAQADTDDETGEELRGDEGRLLCAGELDLEAGKSG